MGKTTLSVYIPNYNHARYIGEALDSVLSQSFRPMEVVVIDDGSIDNSIEVIESFVRRDPIVRLIRNSCNLGPVPTENRALEILKGDYIFGLSADDKVLPGCFQKSMNLLTRYPQAGLCCSDPVTFDDHTGMINENRLHWSEKPRYFLPDELSGVIRRGWMAGHTAVMKRGAVLAAGRLIPELKWHCDWFLILVISFRYGICYIPEPLAALRITRDSYSNIRRRDWPAQREVLNHILRYLKSPDYRDVLPFFRRGCVFRPLGREITRVIFGNPEHWDFQSLSLIPFRLMIRDMIGSVTPSALKCLYHRICQDGRAT